jgi:myo-inositol-1(or 4)-monophosphatase
MSDTNFDRLTWTIQTALTAGQILLDAQSTARMAEKADGSAVSAADFAADAYITQQIHATFPENAIISEESGVLAQAKLLGETWVVDPLDGSTNYLHQIPFWGVSIAFLRNGEPELAVLYFPANQELVYAQRGQGAFAVQLPDGQPLPLQPCPASLTANQFYMQCSRTQATFDLRVPCKPRMFGAAAYNLLTVAKGNMLFAIEVTPKIWDIAAVWLILQESGATVAALQGVLPFPLEVNRDYTRQSFCLLAAADASTWEAVRVRTQPHADLS